MPASSAKPSQEEEIFKQTIRNIKNKTIGKYKSNNHHEWIFCKSNKIHQHVGRINSRFIVLNSDGSIDLAFLPNIISEEIIRKVKDYLEKNKRYFEKLFEKKPSIIIGTWNRYKKFIFTCSHSDEKVNQLASICNNFVKSLLQNYSQSMIQLLKKVDPILQKFAGYSTLCLNNLTALNYNISEKPYKPHHDKHDIGLAVLLYFGTFEGGELMISELGWENVIDDNGGGNEEMSDELLGNDSIIFPIQENDVVLINGKKFKHQVLKVTSGQRVGLVYFVGTEHVPMIRIRRLKNRPKSDLYNYVIKKRNKYYCIVKKKAIPFFPTNPSSKQLKKLLGLREERKTLAKTKRKQYCKKFKRKN